MVRAHKQPLSAIIRVIEVVATVLVFFEYSFSWRESVLCAVGAWCLGFLEGIIVAIIMAVIVHVLFHPIMTILKSLIELGNKKRVST